MRRSNCSDGLKNAKEAGKISEAGYVEKKHQNMAICDLSTQAQATNHSHPDPGKNILAVSRCLRCAILFHFQHNNRNEPFKR